MRRMMGQSRRTVYARAVQVGVAEFICQVLDMSHEKALKMYHFQYPGYKINGGEYEIHSFAF